MASRASKVDRVDDEARRARERNRVALVRKRKSPAVCVINGDAAIIERRALVRSEDDWKGQAQRHSLGWVCARDGDQLVGFVNVPWDGAVTPSSWTPW